MTFPQAPSERNSRTRWLKVAAAFWLLLISAVALINSVGLSRLAEQTQSSAQDAQVKALGLRVADLERQADAFLYFFLDFRLGAADGLQRGQLVQAHGRGLQRALGLGARAAHAPARAVACAVIADEVHLRIAFRRAAAQQGTRILRADGFLAHVGQGAAAPQHLEQTRRGVVQGQAQGVEQGALARARGAADGKQAGRRQRFLLEVDFKFAGQRGQVLAADFEDFHVFF
mgnify:CR=1 FL=1